MSTPAIGADWIDGLRRLDPCDEALTFVEGCASPAEAWATCARADWMLWLLGRLSGDRESAARKRLVLCACACARTALVYVPSGETRPLAAIETAERWARGEAGVTLKDVRAAAFAAFAAFADVAASAASAAFAASAASAASAAFAADVAAYAAADAADIAGWTETRAATLNTLADLVRQHYPEPPVIGEQA